MAWMVRLGGWSHKVLQRVSHIAGFETIPIDKGRDNDYKKNSYWAEECVCISVDQEWYAMLITIYNVNVCWACLPTLSDR